MSSASGGTKVQLFTPPQLSPLNLDLASLEGGGYAPAQFDGKTHDGRDVYCRYRGGWLEVWIAQQRGTDAYRSGTCILQERIGPLLHGGLTLGQLCRYTHITINGEKPDLPDRTEMLEEGCLDLSGATSFYDFMVNSTPSTASHILDRLMQEIPDLWVVEPNYVEHRIRGGRICQSSAQINSFLIYLVIGAKPSADFLSRLDEWSFIEDLPDQLVCHFLYPGFKRQLHPYTSPFPDLSEQIGHRVRIAGQDPDCLYDMLSAKIRIQTGNSHQISRVAEVDHILRDCFQTIAISSFNLQTGRILQEDVYRIPMDPKIRDWLLTDDDRWLSISREDRNQPISEMTGYRPRKDAE